MSNYYAIRNKALANAIHWLTGQRYYRYDDERGGNIYSFERTENFFKALDELNTLKQVIEK